MIAAVLLKSMTYDATVCDKRKHLLFLLTIDIPKLFDIRAGAQPCISMQKFQDDWKNFMKDKHMQVASHECLSTFLVSTLSMMYRYGMPKRWIEYNIMYKPPLLLYYIDFD